MVTSTTSSAMYGDNDNSKVQSDDCTEPTITTDDDVEDSKEFQKELMSSITANEEKALAKTDDDDDDDDDDEKSITNASQTFYESEDEDDVKPDVTKILIDDRNVVDMETEDINTDDETFAASIKVETPDGPVASPDEIDSKDIKRDLMDHALRMAEKALGYVPVPKKEPVSDDEDGAGGKRKSDCDDSPIKRVKKEEPDEDFVGNATVKEELEDGELEDGELPDELVTIDTTQYTPAVTKSHPIDFDHFNRKRKVALLIAYSGGGFHGMQKNPDVETIELRLMEALADIQAIRPDLKNEFLVNNNNQISFNRAARTDKGVSAARQVVSLKLIANENFLVEVNEKLPEEIRVFGLERVTKSFDAKLSCSGRSYEYLVPTVAFAPSRDIMDSTYRISEEQFSKVNMILGMYIGTHNFHNFTSGKRHTDKSAVRYITAFSASKPFECRGHEFMALEVQGQSFLIHQIRKMVGLAIAICRGYCGIDTVDRSWKERKLDIPKAPGLGLLLHRVDYKAYNQKYGNDGSHNPLTWESCELDVERYKIETLWHTIIEEEIKRSSCVKWLKTLNNHTYTEAGMNAPMNNEYKGKKGVFPHLADSRRDGASTGAASGGGGGGGGGVEGGGGKSVHGN